MTADAGGVALLSCIQAFQERTKKMISSVSFSANGFHAATSSLDNTVKIWDLRRRRVGYTLPAHTNIVSEVRYSPSGEQLRQHHQALECPGLSHFVHLGWPLRLDQL